MVLWRYRGARRRTRHHSLWVETVRWLVRHEVRRLSGAPQGAGCVVTCDRQEGRGLPLPREYALVTRVNQPIVLHGRSPRKRPASEHKLVALAISC